MFLRSHTKGFPVQQTERRNLLGLVAIVVLVSMLLTACSSGLSSLSGNDDGDTTPQASEMVDQEAGQTATVTDDESTEADDATADDGSNETESDQNSEVDSDDYRPADEPSDVERAVEKVKPAVVFLAVQVQTTGAFGMPEQQEGVGSGVIFNDEGYILTNNHVIEGATLIDVVLPDGRTFEGNVVGRSPERDLAIVDVDTDEELPVADLAEGGSLRIGQSVVAIGNALGLPGGPTVTTGVVSALGRTIEVGMGMPPMENLVQTDAAINPGNSGGPLINLNGEVVGVNTARIQQAEGIGFAVSIDTASQFIQQVVEHEPQPYIGISGLDISPALAQQHNLPVDYGVMIVEIAPGSPAEDVDIQPGDILIAMNGERVETVQQLQTALTEYDPGDEVTLTFNREGSEIEVQLALGESPIVR
jgi:serine protease Do